MEIPIYNDRRDHTYAQLIKILFSSSNKPLCAKNEHDLWQLIHDIVTLNKDAYKFFIDALQRMRAVHELTDVIFRRLLTDQERAEEIEELRNRKMSISPPFKKQYLILISELASLPEENYECFLVLIESLRDAEIHPVLEYFTPHLP
jgi:hypothetical protein